MVWNRWFIKIHTSAVFVRVNEPATILGQKLVVESQYSFFSPSFLVEPPIFHLFPGLWWHFPSSLPARCSFVTSLGKWDITQRILWAGMCPSWQGACLPSGWNAYMKAGAQAATFEHEKSMCQEQRKSKMKGHSVSETTVTNTGPKPPNSAHLSHDIHFYLV